MLPSLHIKDILKRPLFIPFLTILFVIIIHGKISSPKIDKDLLNQKALFKGIIVADPQVKGDKTRLTVSLISRLKPNSRDAKGIILLSILSNSLHIKEGDQILFRTKLKEPSAYRNPGGFNYARYLTRKGIVATGFIENRRAVRLVSRHSPSVWKRTITDTKQNIRRIIEANTSERARGIVLALLWGDRSLLDQSTQQTFRRHGLSHLLVISGLHFGALALAFFYIVLGSLRLFPKLLLMLSARKVAAGITLALLTFYFLFCESSPSVMRAYIGVSCFLLALILGRSRDLLNILFLAAILILLINPSDLYNLSFQFSFAAVFSLVLILPKIKKYVQSFSFFQQRVHQKGKLQLFLRRLGNLFLANLAIFIGLTPLLVFYFHEIQWNSLIMNLWAVPFVELLVVPLGFLCLVMSILVSPLAGLLFSLEGSLIDGMIRFLEIASVHLPPPSSVFPPHQWELFVFYGLVLILCLNMKSWLKKAMALACIVVLLCSGGFALFQAFRSNDFKVTHIDVGQGDALLVELPGAKRVLIDGGGSPHFDIGKNVVIPFLLHKRIPSLDAVCITHADSDHYLGLSSLIENYKVKELWWNGISETVPAFQELLTKAENRGIRIVELNEGDEMVIGSKARFEVLSPPIHSSTDLENNNKSLVLRLEVDSYVALFTGDIEFPIEEELVRQNGQLLDVDYLKVPHHGSRSSSTMPFLLETSPLVASLGAKRGNHFGHPYSTVVKRYQELGIPLYRTDWHGAIEINFREREIEVIPFVGTGI